jgi:hypothetical protein
MVAFSKCAAGPAVAHRPTACRRRKFARCLSLQAQYGDKARFLLCSESPQPSIGNLFGLGASSASSSVGESTTVDGGTTSGLQARLARLLAAQGVGAAAIGEETAYAAARGAVRAAMDEADERALWSRYGVRL